MPAYPKLTSGFVRTRVVMTNATNDTVDKLCARLKEHGGRKTRVSRSSVIRAAVLLIERYMATPRSKHLLDELAQDIRNAK